MNHNELTTKQAELEATMAELWAKLAKQQKAGDTEGAQITSDTYWAYQGKLEAINRQLGL